MQRGQLFVGSRMKNFGHFVQQKRLAPLIWIALVMGIGVVGGVMYALSAPSAIVAKTQTTNAVAPPEPLSTMHMYGRTADGTIPTATTPQPLQQQQVVASDPRTAADTRVANIAPQTGNSESDIMNANLQPPTWAHTQTTTTATAPVDHAPRVAVVYDATNGHPTLIAQNPGTTQYDVPPIVGPPPAALAGVAHQVAQSVQHAAQVAQQDTASSDDAAKSMVMPDVESTPGVVTIPAGTRIPAVLDQAVDSDLQGPVHAHITSDVCDPRTGALAIARGAWLLGNQGGGITNGSRHLGIVWTQLTNPDLTARLLFSTDTLDNEGHTGLAGRPNYTRYDLFRDTITQNIAQTGGQILTSAVAPRIAGTSVTLNGTSITTAATQPLEQHTQSWTLARNTPFLLYLEHDFDRKTPYRNQYCGG